MLDNALRNQLAKKLRDIHADIGAAEIPPRFARLLGEPPIAPHLWAPPAKEFLAATTSLLNKLKPQSGRSHRNKTALLHLFVAVPQPARRPVKSERSSAAKRRTLDGPSQAPVTLASQKKQPLHLPLNPAPPPPRLQNS